MPRQTVTESKLTSPFLMEDLLHGVKALKNNKAAGLDDMLCEQIKHFGEATGFRPGTSTTGQLLNLTQHIEDGYERGVVTGTVFVDISAAYDTINRPQATTEQDIQNDI